MTTPKAETKNRIEARTVRACPYGGLGCMDCIEGQCEGIGNEVEIEILECDCGGHDVWGEMYHFETCEHHIPEPS